MKKLVFMLLIAFSASLFSQAPMPFKDKFIIISEKCTIVAVNMVDGVMSHKEADAGYLHCTPDKAKIRASCEFWDSKYKLLIKKEMVAGIVGQQGLVTSDNQTDTYSISMVTKKIYSHSNINIDHGSIMGQKICSGDFVWESEIKKKK